MQASIPYILLPCQIHSLSSNILPVKYIPPAKLGGKKMSLISLIYFVAPIDQHCMFCISVPSTAPTSAHTALNKYLLNIRPHVEKVFCHQRSLGSMLTSAQCVMKFTSPIWTSASSTIKCVTTELMKKSSAYLYTKVL